MKVLVTGGAGYVGSHACKALAAKGLEPVAYDNLSRGNRWAVKWGPLEQGDIRDEARLGEVLNRYQPVAVMHFAAFAYVGESVQQPLLYYQNNVSGSATLFHAIIKTRPIPVVFSSCHLWGPRKNPNSGGTSATPNQSLRLFQTRGGAHVGRSRPRLWSALDRAALFQCCGR